MLSRLWADQPCRATVALDLTRLRRARDSDGVSQVTCTAHGSCGTLKVHGIICARGFECFVG
jgi:hypothetical protein